MIEKQAYKLSEFCVAYGLGRSKTYEEIAAGRLKVVKIGRKTLISREAATDWFSLRQLAAK